MRIAERLERKLVRFTWFSRALTQLAEVLGLCLVAIGLSIIAGYFTGEGRLYQWFSNDIGMALGVGVAFTFCGIIFFVFAVKLIKLEKRVKKIEDNGK